jgi:hypothetical protein
VIEAVARVPRPVETWLDLPAVAGSLAGLPLLTVR